MPRRIAAIALTLAPALAFGACGSDGGDDTRKVSNARIPFTFELPKDFKEKSLRQGTSQGSPPIVAYGIDELNLIDVRQSARAALPLETVDRQLKTSLSQLGFANEQSTREKHNGIEMIVFDVNSRVSGKPTRSKLYFFTGGGGTWEIECQSSGGGADEVDGACKTALDSIEFTKD